MTGGSNQDVASPWVITGGVLLCGRHVRGPPIAAWTARRCIRVTPQSSLSASKMTRTGPWVLGRPGMRAPNPEMADSVEWRPAAVDGFVVVCNRRSSDRVVHWGGIACKYFYSTICIQSIRVAPMDSLYPDRHPACPKPRCTGIQGGSGINTGCGNGANEIHAVPVGILTVHWRLLLNFVSVGVRHRSAYRIFRLRLPKTPGRLPPRRHRSLRELPAQYSKVSICDADLSISMDPPLAAGMSKYRWQQLMLPKILCGRNEDTRSRK